MTTRDPATLDRARRMADHLYDPVLVKGAGRPTEQQIDAIADALEATEEPS